MTGARAFVVSAGKGSEENVMLGKLIVSGARRRGIGCVSLETRLRQAVDAPSQCSVDGIYRDEPLNYLDNEFLAIHAASGMRVASGCPVRLLYGVHGGCDACKCRVPNFQEVKRFCPFYGSGARYATMKMSWENSQKLQEMFLQCKCLVILSANEDLAAPLDNPTRRNILKYQMGIVDEAKKANVERILLIGPSDNVPLGQSSIAKRLMQDAQVSKGLNKAKSQLAGLKVWDNMQVSENSKPLQPLAIERYLDERGITYQSIRAPYAFITTEAIADLVVENLIHAGSADRIVVDES